MSNGLTLMEMAMAIMQMALKVISSRTNKHNGMIQTRMVLEIIQTVSLQMHAQIPTDSPNKIALVALILISMAIPIPLLTGRSHRVLMLSHNKVPNGETVMVMVTVTT